MTESRTTGSADTANPRPETTHDDAAPQGQDKTLPFRRPEKKSKEKYDDHGKSRL